MNSKIIEIELYNGITESELELLNLIKIEDLNDDTQILAERYGIDFVRDFIQNFGGFTFYIIQKSNCKSVVTEIVKRKYNDGLSVKKIAKDMKLSPRFIQNILRN